MPFTEHNINGLVYDTADGLDAVGGIRHAFTTRLGGVSPAPFDSLNFFFLVEQYQKECLFLMQLGLET